MEMGIGQAVLRVVGSLGSASKAIVPITVRGDLPPLLDRAVDRDLPDRLVAFWRGRTDDDRGDPELRRALEPEEHAALVRRVSALSAAVAPAPVASRDVLLDEIEGMLGAYPSMQRHDEEAAGMIAASYLWTVREEPHWAIVEACGLVRGNKAGLNPSFPPTEPEFAKVVALRAAMYRLRLRETEAILRAKIQPPPEPKLTAEEIAAKLGRPIGARPTAAHGDPAKVIDEAAARIARSIEHGTSVRRVQEDLARRRERAV